MNTTEIMKTLVDLGEYGGNRLFTVQELVDMVINTKKMSFLKKVVTLKDGENDACYCFDAMAFNAAMSDFYVGFPVKESGYEGTLEYEVIAGGDWVWNCKTTIEWVPVLPEAFGELHYHSEIVSKSETVKPRINAMTGTSMKIVMKRNTLQQITWEDAIQRTQKAMEENK